MHVIISLVSSSRIRNRHFVKTNVLPIKFVNNVMFANEWYIHTLSTSHISDCRQNEKHLNKRLVMTSGKARWIHSIEFVANVTFRASSVSVCVQPLDSGCREMSHSWTQLWTYISTGGVESLRKYHNFTSQNMNESFPNWKYVTMNYKRYSCIKTPLGENVFDAYISPTWFWDLGGQIVIDFRFKYLPI